MNDHSLFNNLRINLQKKTQNMVFLKIVYYININGNEQREQKTNLNIIFAIKCVYLSIAFE